MTTPQLTLTFKDLKITTMTLVFQMHGITDKDAVFFLLPVAKVPLPNIRERQKYKLPLAEVPGSILSVRFKKIIRGIVENNKNKFFKNSVTLKMSTSVKNISMKISPKTIQLCGASSRKEGYEAVNYMMQHLNDIHSVMSEIHERPQDYINCVNYLEEAVKGPPMDKPIIEERKMRGKILKIHRKLKDFSLQIPTNIPANLNSHMLNYMILLMADQTYYNDYIGKIKHLIHFPPVYDEPLSIKCANEVMVNYNYNLGFKVNRDELNRLIDGRYGLYSIYDNALVNYVTIELPYNENLEYTAKKIKKKIPHHTFLIYKSGAVTQSGPCSSTQPGKCSTLMEEAFNTFMKALHEIIEHVVLN